MDCGFGGVGVGDVDPGALPSGFVGVENVLGRWDGMIGVRDPRVSRSIIVEENTKAA